MNRTLDESSEQRRLGVFKYRSFSINWVGGLFSNTGTWVQSISASVLIYDITGSAYMVGMLNFANFAPVLLFSMLGGVLADRFNRKRVVTVTHLIPLAFTVSLALMTFAGWTTSALLLLLTFGIGTSYSLAKPALTALIPALVPPQELSRATAINTLQFIIGQVVGSSLAALILLVGDVAWAFAINSISFLGPIVAMQLITLSRIRSRQQASKGGLSSLIEGFRFVRGNQAILVTLAAVVFANGALEALRTLAPVFAADVHNQGGSAVGLFIASSSIGSVVALVLFGTILNWLNHWQMAAAGFVFQGVGIVVFALAPLFLIALAAPFLIGFGFSFLIPILNARLQELSPEDFRGRVMATFAMAHMGMRPVSALSAGLIASLSTAQFGMIAFALLVPFGLFAVKSAVEAQPAKRISTGRTA